MARPIWSGSISFGLVNVPVKLFSATSPKEVRFHMLHDEDGGRIQQKRVCSIDGEEVPWEHIVKGFEVAKGRYVTVTKEELEAFSPKATRSIDIEDFVDLHQIDTIYYDHSYYLVPVWPMGKSLALSTMLYADEVVDQSELEGLPGAEAKPREKELHMAEQLVQSLATDFDPKKYKDTFREQVLALLERKAEGQEIVAEPAEEEPRGKVVNLMDALAKSLAAARKGEAPQAGERRRSPEPERAAARTSRAPARRRRAA